MRRPRRGRACGRGAAAEGEALFALSSFFVLKQTSRFASRASSTGVEKIAQPVSTQFGEPSGIKGCVNLPDGGLAAPPTPHAPICTAFVFAEHEDLCAQNWN